MPIAKPQAKKYVTVEDFHQQNSRALGLQLLSGHAGLNRKIREPTVNRPGLALAGFTKYFAGKRIQVIGSAESNFLKSLSRSKRELRYRDLMSRG
ncbi:MAG TPA: hypothetical protein EYG38_20375, partial [Verrucomicrobia bacterium]|nr:hypothetical protein [Verrucomicrobiota bacterium]